MDAWLTRSRIRTGLLLYLPCLSLLLACSQEQTGTATIRVADALGNNDPAALAGYARAFEPRLFVFPADHFAHPEFRNEWWYVTGNLETAGGAEFGYQLTLFRIAIAPQPSERASAWAANQIWMGHLALTHIQDQTHYASEQFARQALGLAGADSESGRIWLHQWQLQYHAASQDWELHAETGDFGLSLLLNPLKAPVLQGDRGLSQKSAEAGNASYYYSLPRLATRGELRFKGQNYTVEGLSWLDREWSTSALGPEQSGWDWFSLQLDSGEDLMFYQLRRKDGSRDPHSSGSWIATDSSSIRLGAADVELEPQNFWRGPSGAEYPIRWRMRIPRLNRNWLIEAAVPDQLMNLSVQYWEGAVRVRDAESGALVGRGYLEMTGWDETAD